MRFIKHYLCGVSVGIGSAPSSIAVIEAESVTEHGELVGKVKEMRLRHLERLPLSASYPDLAKRLRAVRDGLAKVEQGPSSGLLVDITGTGRSVVRFLREESLAPIEVTITAGAGQKEIEPGWWRVSKTELVGQLNVLFQSDVLKIADGLDLVPAFKDELANFRMRATAANGDDIDAWRQGASDDLVFAVALATWRGQTDIPPSKAAIEEMNRKLDEWNKKMDRGIV